MPTQSVRLKPGVNTVATPALNEAGISASNMIRFREGLVEKRGGFNKYYGFPVSGIPRVIWPWEDLENVTHVAVGATQSLSVITGGAALDVTPLQNTTNTASTIATTSGSAVVTITDTANNCTAFDSVDFRTQVSAGGLILFGLYAVTPTGANTFTITASSNATSTVSIAPVVPSFTTAVNQFSVVVTLPNHNKTVGSTIAFPVATSVGGLTIQGFYTVVGVASSSVFTINAPMAASSTATVSMNGGVAQLLYWIVALPPTLPLGFGIGGFGLGGFGTGQIGSGRTASTLTTTDWTLANFGEILLACPANGPIFQWSPSGGFQTAAININAPSYNAGILVADTQQMVVAWGSSILGQQDPLLVRWSDDGNYNTWVAGVTNQAGEFRIPTGSQIVSAIVAAGQILFFTDIDLWSAQYVGYPDVWGFNKIATGCGLIGPKARVKIGDAVFWMSQNAFWVYQGGVAQPIDCPVHDDVYPVMDRSNVTKIRGGANSHFNEALWFYPSTFGGGENDSYVCINPLSSSWDIGSITRSAWADQSVVGRPIGGAPTGFIYQHETSPDADGSPIMASFTTGYFMLSEGEDLNYVDLLHPDVKWSAPGTIQVTLLVADESVDTPLTYGPYSITMATRFINLNLRGRMIALQFSSSDIGSIWRIGNMRFRFQASGRR